MRSRGQNFRAWLAILTLALIPIILALVNQEWMFTRAGEDDPWWYISLGYFYYKEPLLGASSYKISRVPWILVESFIRNLFTPTAAAIVLTLLIIIPGSIGFYLLVSRYFNQEVGFISAALLSTYSWYMVSRSPDYHNAAGSLFFIWSLYFLTLAVQSNTRPRLWLVVCGAVYGLAVHSEFFVLGCLPAMLVQFVMLNWAGKKRPLLEAVLFGLLGFLSTTALLGLAAVLSGRSFFFFMNQIIFLGHYSGDLRFFYRPANSGWPLQANYLALPAAAFLFAVGWAIKDAIKSLRFHLELDGRSWMQLSLSLQLIVVGIIWLVLELLKKKLSSIIIMSTRFIFMHFWFLPGFWRWAGANQFPRLSWEPSHWQSVCRWRLAIAFLRRWGRAFFLVGRSSSLYFSTCSFLPVCFC